MKYQFNYEAKVGKLSIFEENNQIVKIAVANDVVNDSYLYQETDLIQTTMQQLDEYFEGVRISLSAPFALSGTPFQLKVWRKLQEIPYGNTRSYREIAREIGHEKAVRAVGSAIGKNPLLILIPCHRVIGSNKKLCGYSGGLPMKTELLSIESENINCRCYNKENVKVRELI